MPAGWILAVANALSVAATAVGGGNVAATVLSVDTASLVVAALSKAAEVWVCVPVCMATPLLAAALVAAALSVAERVGG